MIVERYIKCHPHELDQAKDVCEKLWGGFSHFTVGNGKAEYHMLTLANHSCGIYYAVRVTDEGLCCKRALEPMAEIHVHPAVLRNPLDDADPPEAMEGLDANYHKYA